MSNAGQTGQFDRWNDEPAVIRVLHQGLEIVADLNDKLRKLDDLMLKGRPHEIAEAAAVVETSLKAASPALSDIATTMERFGTANLQAAAAYLRRAEQDDAANLADALRLALKRFANRSVEANRRAQHLNRGLNTAMRSLQALGVQESGRLIAEA